MVPFLTFRGTDILFEPFAWLISVNSIKVDIIDLLSIFLSVLDEIPAFELAATDKQAVDADVLAWVAVVVGWSKLKNIILNGK